SRLRWGLTAPQEASTGTSSKLLPYCSHWLCSIRRGEGLVEERLLMKTQLEVDVQGRRQCEGQAEADQVDPPEHASSVGWNDRRRDEADERQRVEDELDFRLQ